MQVLLYISEQSLNCTSIQVYSMLLCAQYQTLLDVTFSASPHAVLGPICTLQIKVACPGAGFHKCRFQCYAYIFRVNALKNFPSVLWQATIIGYKVLEFRFCFLAYKTRQKCGNTVKLFILANWLYFYNFQKYSFL